MVNGSSAAALGARAPSSNLIGLGLAVFTGLLIGAMSAIGMMLGGSLPPLMLSFAFCLFSTLVLVPWLMRVGFARLRTSNAKLHLARGIAFTAAMVTWFIALPHVPLADISAIGFTTTLYVMIGAILFLGETSRAWRWAALAAGFAGTLIVLRPGFAEIGWAYYLIVVAAVMMAAARLLVKVATRADAPEVMVAWQMIISTVITFPFALYFWVWPTLEQTLWLVAFGVAGSAQQITAAWSIKLADFGVIEPAGFLKLFWAALLGWIFFAEVPALATVIGSAFIIGSVIYIARRERRENGPAAAFAAP
jgi:drug/metabolite transporter (DMT)-like permease